MTTLLFLCDGLEQNIVTILKTLYCEPVVKVLEMGQYSSVLLPPYCYLKQPSSIGKSLGSWNKCVTLLLERKVFRRFRIIFGMARRKLRQSFVLAIFLGPFCFSETGLCKWLYLFVANRRWGYSKEVISPVRVFNWLKLNILDHSWNKMTEALFYTFCIPKRTLSRPYRRYGIHFLYSYSENYPRCENYFRNYLWVALREKW